MYQAPSIERLERVVEDHNMPYHTSGQTMKLFLAAQNVHEEALQKERPVVVTRMTRHLSRVLYWVAKVAARYGYSLDEIASIALEDLEESDV